MRALLASPLGFVIGLSLGALGGGGSILAVPALVYVAGQDPRQATTTSLLVVGSVSLLGMAAHLRAGRVDVRAGMVFGAAGIGGSLLGSLLNRSVDENVLLLAFSFLMLFAAWRMVGGSASPRPVSETAAVTLAVGGAGTVVGFLTGFFGVGGGFVVVPALVLVLGFAMPQAVGTSLLVIVVNSAVALATRLATTGVEWSVAIPFTAAGLVGVLAGTRLAGRIPAARLQTWFAALLVVVAIYTGIRSALAL